MTIQAITNTAIRTNGLKLEGFADRAGVLLLLAVTGVAGAALAFIGF